MKPLKRITIRSHKVADYKLEKKGKIRTLKKNEYCLVDGYSIGGEAPKSFIRVYEYQDLSKSKKIKKEIKKQRKTNVTTWTLYIAKLGHKWYPIESVTEHLIARIGAVVGLNMAHSRLAQINNQVRFLSKYFIDHDKGQELVHGTDILVAHLNDRNFVREVQITKREPEFFTLETTVEAITNMFPKNHNEIIEAYFLMLIFDAWVGVQDRHFDNWAIVRNIFGKNDPYFSPIYDSARGLFWNEREEKILNWFQYKQVDAQIENQIRNSMPQVGLNTMGKVSHFVLIEEVLSDRFISIKSKARAVFSQNAMNLVQKMIETEFEGILSRSRIRLIIRCLNVRYIKLQNFLQ